MTKGVLPFQVPPDAEHEPPDLDLLADTLVELAKEIERDEIVPGSRAELVSDLLATGDTRELVRALIMHAGPGIDRAALDRAITSDASTVWRAVVGRFLRRRGADEIAAELRRRARQMRAHATRTHPFLRLAGAMRP